MPNSERPAGQRFSQVYLSSPDLLSDSKRMRRRLGELIGTTYLRDFSGLVPYELGISFDVDDAQYPSFWPTFCEKAQLRNVLDVITLRYQNFGLSYYDSTGEMTEEAQKLFLNEARRIFREEQVHYVIDDKGGVHFSVDAEFANVRASTIAALSSARYNGARQSFEDAHKALDKMPPDGKAAIRATFFAAEGLFRLMFSSAPQLNGSEVTKHLKPLVDSFYATERPALHVAQKQLAAFREWIDGAHFYRHEPGTPEPAQPPIDLAVYIVSQGASHIRWLAQVDKSPAA